MKQEIAFQDFCKIGDFWYHQQLNFLRCFCEETVLTERRNPGTCKVVPILVLRHKPTICLSVRPEENLV